MDNIPDNIIDKKLYLEVKKEADNKYKRHSAYKSMYISKLYKEKGGRYKKQKKDNKLQKWTSEKWIQMKPYIMDNKKIACGSTGNPNTCRPYKRIDSQTPITADEAIKKHGKKKLLDLINKKLKNMDLRINWNEGLIK